jgi:hypothetical protein
VQVTNIPFPPHGGTQDPVRPSPLSVKGHNNGARADVLRFRCTTCSGGGKLRVTVNGTKRMLRFSDGHGTKTATLTFKDKNGNRLTPYRVRDVAGLIDEKVAVR